MSVMISVMEDSDARLTDLAPIFGGGVTIAGAMYGACAAAEKAARPEALKDIGHFLKDHRGHGPCDHLPLSRRFSGGHLVSGISVGNVHGDLQLQR